MIEVRLIDNKYGNWEEYLGIRPTEENFRVYNFKINDIIYTEYSNEFKTAFDGDKLWSKIKNEENWLDRYLQHRNFESNEATIYNSKKLKT